MTRLNRFTANLLLVLGAITLPQAHAAWPDDQPIHIIVPQAPGGTNDTAARIVAVELGKTLAKQILPALTQTADHAAFDTSTQGLMGAIKALR